MKKTLILSLLILLLTNALSAEIFFKLYPGLYLGGDTIENFAFTIGGDLQLGFEFGEFVYDDIIFGIYTNTGIDTGLPNRPNFYYGGIMELYFVGDEIKFGISAGGGYNTGIDSDLNDLRSGYLRVGLPINFMGVFKSSLCFDLYFDIGYRLGWIMHLGKGF
jgi:hypothetical protein